MLWSKNVNDSKPRAFSSLIRPLVCVGVWTGVFPFTIDRTTTHNPTTGKAEASVTYKLVFFSFSSFLAVVWFTAAALCIVRGHKEEPFEGADLVEFFGVLNTWVSVLYIFSFLSMLVTLVQYRRVEDCLATLTHLDTLIPTPGTNVIRLQVVIILYLFLAPLFSHMRSLQLAEQFGDVVDIITSLVLSLYVWNASFMYTFLMWVFAAHLTEKFESVNTQLQATVQNRDVNRLHQLRGTHKILRRIVEDVDVLLWIPVALNYFLTMFVSCMILTVVYVENATGMLSLPQLALQTITSLTSPLALFLNNFYPHRCINKARETVKVFDCQDLADDEFSRQVSNFRSELCSSRVSFTVAGLLDLDLQELWREAQFMVTLVVVMVQFSMESYKTQISTLPLNGTHT